MKATGRARGKGVVGPPSLGDGEVVVAVDRRELDRSVGKAPPMEAARRRGLDLERAAPRLGAVARAQERGLARRAVAERVHLAARLPLRDAEDDLGADVDDLRF